MYLRKKQNRQNLLQPALTSLISFQILLIYGHVLGDSNSDLRHELIPITSPSPLTPNNVAGNADSTDPFWASNGAGIYFISYASNFDVSQEDALSEPHITENLYLWDRTTGVIHSISQDSHLFSSGPIQQIIETPESGDVFFSRLNPRTSGRSVSTLFHYKKGERSVSVFNPEKSSNLDYIEEISGLGPDSRFPFASAYYSPENSPDFSTNIKVPVYYNTLELQWEEAAPELFEREFRSLIWHGYNSNFSNFLVQVEAQNYSDFETESGNYSNLWFNDGKGSKGQMVELATGSPAAQQLGRVLILEVHAARDLALAIVVNSSHEAPVTLVQIDLGSMSTTPIPSEFITLFNPRAGIKIDHTGSYTVVADSNLLKMSQVSEFIWFNIPENDERLINLKEVFPDSDWRLVGFWGQTQDLHLRNFNNQIARWNPEATDPDIFTLSGADFVYSVSPDGNQVAIQTAEPLALDLDKNNMEDIYLASMTDSEATSSPTLISRGTESAPAGLKTKMNVSYLTQLENILDPDAESIILGVPEEWSETSTGKDLTPTILSQDVTGASLPITDLIKLSAGEKLKRTNVSPGGKLIACVVESDESLPGSTSMKQHLILVRRLGEDFEIWEPEANDFSQVESFSAAKFLQPSIDEDNALVYLLASLSSSDVRLCKLDISTKEIQSFRIPTTFTSPNYLLDYSATAEGPIVTQGGRRIFLPLKSSIATRRPYALIFNSQDNEFYSLADLDQDNVLGTLFNFAILQRSQFSFDGDFLGILGYGISSNVFRVNLSEFPQIIIETLENSPSGIQFQNWTQIQEFRISNEGKKLFLIASSGIKREKIPFVYNWDQQTFTFAGLSKDEMESMIGTTVTKTRLQSAQADSRLSFVALQYFIQDSGSEQGAKHTFIKSLETGSVVHLDIPNHQIIGQPILSNNGALALIKTHHGSPSFPETEFFLVSLSEIIEVPEDSDDDGLPDAWETEHFQSLVAAPQEDIDLDGLSNHMEWVLGLNPLDSESTIRLMIEHDTDLNGILLKWKTANAGQFSIEARSPDQNSVWHELHLPFTLFGGEAHLRLVPVESGSLNMYRLKFSLD
jgi:hypothetical protein